MLLAVLCSMKKKRDAVMFCLFVFLALLERPFVFISDARSLKFIPTTNNSDTVLFIFRQR
jgi:hypothetical protein